MKPCAAPPTPEQVREALLGLAAQLPGEAASQARNLADGIRRAPWYQWERICRRKEARAIDLDEARGIISQAEACRRRIALLIASEGTG